MPTAAPRLRVLLASAAVAVLASLVPILAPVLPGTPAAAAPAATNTPCPVPACVLPPPPTTSTAPSPTATATPVRTAKPVATVSPAPRRTPQATRSPQSRTTYAAPAGSTASPVTEVVSVGAASGVLGPLPTTPPRADARTARPGDPVGRLVTLVLGAAVLLGVGGATGLYLTRQPRER